MSHERRALGRLETTKDTLQVIVESGAVHTGRIALIVSGAVRDVARELGDWATDVFEIRDAARRAQGDLDDGPEPIVDPPRLEEARRQG
jgi:hypothetical protein